MKIIKYCIVLLLTIVSSPIFSQTNNNTILSVSKTDSILVSISINDLNTLKSENDSLILQLTEINEKYQKLLVESNECKNELYNLERDVNLLISDTTKLHMAQREADRRLVNITSNFLYIPYEAYSVEKIAIPAFRAIANAELKDKHQIKYELLCNYRKDIEDIMSFMEYAHSELIKPFVKDANDVLLQFRSKSFYRSYQNYPDWAATFLGGKISLIEKQLHDFDGNQHRVDFTPIKEELNECLKTTEAL